MKWLVLLLFLPLPILAQTAIGPSSGLPPKAGQPYSCINLFGDSITNGLGASTGGAYNGPGSKSYAGLILNAYANCGANWGVDGDQAGDTSLKVMNDIAPTTQGNALSTVMVSTNDYGNYGASAPLQSVFVNALANVIAWSAIPDVAKLSYFGTACTFTGSWTQATAGSIGTGYPASASDATNGDSVTCTLTTTQSGPIYLSYGEFNTGFVAATSAGSIQVDGGTGTTFNVVPTTSTITTFNGNGIFPVLLRLPGPYTAGTHTIKVTNTGPTGGSPGGFLVLNYLASPYAASAAANTPPAVFVGGTPQESAGTNAALVAAYNTLIQNEVATLQSDGLPITFVNVQALLNTTTDFAGGTIANGYVCPASNQLPLHPGNCGHAHLSQSFLNVMPSGFTNGPSSSYYLGPATVAANHGPPLTGVISTPQLGGAVYPPVVAASANTFTALSITGTAFTTTGLALTMPPGSWHAHCSITWEQNTAVSTVQFGMGVSQTPTALNVMNVLSSGAGGITKTDQYTTIANTTVTAISAATAPTAIATGYKNEIDFQLQTGTAYQNIVTLYAKTGATADAVVIEPGSYCGWLQ